MGKAVEIAIPLARPEGTRPVAYVSAKTLSELLDCGESTISDLTKVGILPKPYRIRGLSRWKWSEVENAIMSGQGGAKKPSEKEPDDPILRASRGR